MQLVALVGKTKIILTTTCAAIKSTPQKKVTNFFGDPALPGAARKTLHGVNKYIDSKNINYF